jgi:hypothetical protein
MSLKLVNRVALLTIMLGLFGLSQPRDAAAIPACFQGCVTLASCDDQGWVCAANGCDTIQTSCGEFGTCVGTKKFVNCWEDET